MNEKHFYTHGVVVNTHMFTGDRYYEWSDVNHDAISRTYYSSERIPFTTTSGKKSIVSRKRGKHLVFDQSKLVLFTRLYP